MGGRWKSPALCSYSEAGFSYRCSPLRCQTDRDNRVSVFVRCFVISWSVCGLIGRFTNLVTLTSFSSGVQNVISINRPPLPIYQSVIEKTRGLAFRTQAIGAALSRASQQQQQQNQQQNQQREQGQQQASQPPTGTAGVAGNSAGGPTQGELPAVVEGVR